MTLHLPIAGFLLGLTALPVAAQAPPPGAGSPAIPAGAVPPEEALANSYAADRAAALRQVLARYVDELAALEKSLAAAGDGSGAARVRLEHDRILPALGLPAVAAEDADEFAAFEEPAAVPVPPAPAALPKDLDAILQSLLPGGPDKLEAPVLPAATAGTPGAGPPGKSSKRLVRMGTAALNGTFDPVYPWQYWSAGRTASWTLSELPEGSYQVVVRYACDDKAGGGKLTVRLGETTREVEIAPTGSWKRRRELVAGSFAVKGSRADLVLQPASMKQGAGYLMDLVAVMIVPDGTAANP